MASERVFLGWDRPFLVSAAEWLYQRDAPREIWDLSGEVLVVPGGRAKRRLLELLVTCGANGGVVEPDGTAPAQAVGLIPPRFETLGKLPELLYAESSSDPLWALLAMVCALQQSDPAALAGWCPQRPEPDDLTAWTAIAEHVLSLDEQLAGACLRFEDAAKHCRNGSYPASAAERWDLIAEVRSRYLGLLRREGVADRQEARRAALDARDYHKDEIRITLLATADLTNLTVQMLDKSRAAVQVLIFAPESEAGGFDEWGGLKVEHWHAARLPLQRVGLRIVDQPRDQAIAVAEELAALGERYGPDRITVGLGDAALGGGIERVLELCEVRARPWKGRELPRSRPALLLEALAGLCREKRADRFAAALRHPDLSAWLSRSGLAPGGAEHWLPELDAYLEEHLPFQLGAEWVGDQRKQGTLEAAVEKVRRLVDDLPDGSQRLSAWANPIAGILAQVYGGRDWRRQRPDESAVIEALEAIGEVLRGLEAMGPGHPLAPEVGLGTAVRFVLRQLADQAETLPADPGAVELLEWLELPLDDAPALVVAGLNEGTIPKSVTSDAFLPDRLRRDLGLVDNRRRYAWDALALRTMVESRRHLTLISGRRGAAGDPLLPSRLIFACDDQTLAERVLQFYAGEESPTPARPLLPHGKQSSFALRAPAAPVPPRERLSVTAFADYLACPYRFYLKHVCRLHSPDDSAVEMDPLLFGNVVHGVLQRFGRDSIKGSADVVEIRSFLDDALEQELQARFGRQRLPAVELQTVQLRRRLETFASWQAQHAAEGWEIWKVEHEVEAIVPPVDEAFRIYGRIDRIDSHPDGRWRLLDYKSGETGRTPDQQHRAAQDGNRVWVSLQLPLYRHLAAFGLDLAPERVEVGYIALSREAPRGGLLQLAGWEAEELEAADAAARWVIAGVRGGTFWPPGEPPSFPDGLQGVCYDRCLDRAGLIRGSAARRRPE